MAKKKTNHKSQKAVSQNNKGLRSKIFETNNLFKIILLTIAFYFFYNSSFNYFSLDDYLINTKNPQTVKGIAGIPDIFTTLYFQQGEMAYGYRPIVRTSFALEYQFTKNLSYNPYISHVINILLYLFGILLLYNVLRRLLRNYSPWLPFLSVLIFLANPLHTEVVASLKNRDILLNFIFSFLAIQQFVRWADFNKSKHLLLGIFYFVLALLSKETAIVQLAVFPLVLYFFTDLPLKKLGRFTIIVFVVALIASLGPLLFLPDFKRSILLIENPLSIEPNYWLHISTSFYILGWYLKLLIKPYPMSFYYGYNTFPIVNWTNLWVWVSLLFYLFIAIVALKKLKQKRLISFIILYFIITISPFANLVMPVPGIVGDRFMFFPSLSFAMALTYLLFVIFRLDIHQTTVKLPFVKLIGIGFLLVLLLIPYGIITRNRNKEWRTKYSLFRADINHLRKSVKANDLFATECVNKVNRELAKPVDPYEFVKSMLDTAIAHYKLAVKIYPKFYSAWNNMGAIYSKIHANQALIRYRSYASKGKTKNARMEIKNATRYFNLAQSYFRKSIALNPNYKSAYYNMAYSYELQGSYSSAISYYKKLLTIDTNNIQVMSRLANVYFRNEQLDSARIENQSIKKVDSKSDYPYINMGNYYYLMGDTIDAIKEYEVAVIKGTNKPVAKLLSKYYHKKGDTRMEQYYRNQAYEAEKRQKIEEKNYNEKRY